jgi:hypothetical protein
MKLVAAVPAEQGGFTLRYVFPSEEAIVHEFTCYEIVCALLGCWPEPLLTVAKRVGTANRALDSYIAGKAALDEHVLSRLMKLVGLKYDYGKLLKDGTHPVTSAERYVLIAGNETERVLNAYNFLIEQGQAKTSVELVPAGGTPGHRWRYLLITRYSEIPSLICFPRIGRAASVLERGQLIDFHGQYFVDPIFYDAVALLRADVEQQPSKVLVAMEGFYERWQIDVTQIGAALANNVARYRNHPARKSTH